ncbi:DUF6962 family protein [Nodosilinea sp. PGN35]|uniref:DUF6962 family protein n=1 Tax=Nodosilinea sp. PGN35 TaxID=3020489 RepID=UPI0023B34AD9|nr:hypothetical protein [Nodosilinea sp. TSF1-S3]MDF0366219.1 hypothetical protein [Nodosilinea sp. TSF1-S3]
MTEPLTTLTDYAIALECLVLAGLLWGRGGGHRLWAAAFGSAGGAALLGGTYHGFAHTVLFAQRFWLWHAMGVALAIASFFTVAAAAAPLGRGDRRRLLALATAKLVVALALGFSLWGFYLRVVDYLSALVLVLLVLLVRRRPRAAGWMAAAIAVSVLGATVLLIPLARVSPKVVYHLVQMVALVCIYRSATAEGRAVSSQTAA